MFFSATSMARLLAVLILLPHEAGAQAITPPAPAPAAKASENAPAVLTLKERLGAKWKDDQRVDNCNVRPEQRGAKPRPVACADAPPKQGEPK